VRVLGQDLGDACLPDPHLRLHESVLPEDALIRLGEPRERVLGIIEAPMTEDATGAIGDRLPRHQTGVAESEHVLPDAPEHDLGLRQAESFEQVADAPRRALPIPGFRENVKLRAPAGKWTIRRWPTSC
jgi:hypothetical protein